METNATLMCALLVGLPEVKVLAVDDDDRAGPLRVHVETRAELVGCVGCGTRARLKDRRAVSLVDLAAFGRRDLTRRYRSKSCSDCGTRESVAERTVSTPNWTHHLLGSCSG